MKKKYLLFLLFAGTLALGFAAGFIGIQIVTHPAENIWLIEHGVLPSSSGDRIFTGSFQNRTDNRASHVQTDIDFLNADGEVVESATAETGILEPGEAWTFLIPVSAIDAEHFRINMIRWRDDVRGSDVEFGPYGVQDIKG